MIVGEANGNVDGGSAEGPSSDDESIVALSCTFAASILDRSPHAQADCPARKRRVGSDFNNPCEYCYCFHCDVPVSECNQRDSHAPSETAFSISKGKEGVRDEADIAVDDDGKKKESFPEAEPEFVNLKGDFSRLVCEEFSRFTVKNEHSMPFDDALEGTMAPARVKMEGKATRSVSDRLNAIERTIANILRRLSALETNLENQRSIEGS
jgi:hypothetical protein